MKGSFFIPLLLLTSSIFAQQKEPRIVFDYTKSDTTSAATMMRHARNIMITAGNTKLEIVCHGPGLDMLIKDKTTVQKEIEELQGKFSVVFTACEATMKRRGIDKSQLLPQVTTVQLANLEFAFKQQEGWSYIKAGY
jgi:uncharacterized protein